MATIDSTTSLQQATAQGQTVNPKSILGKDDFLKLLITELQYQDPTSPMDTEKILSQTSQLASLEAQTKTNEALEQLAKSFANTKNFSAVSAIGKMARLDNHIDLKHTKDGKTSPVSFNLDFEDDIKQGAIYIYDEKNRLVKTQNIDPMEKGTHTFTWDGKTTAGDDAKAGKYKIIAKYENSDGLNLEGKFGSYKIESVKFEDEKTYVKLDGSYLAFENVAEIFEPSEGGN
jgi:flagellar basal-body rod modification protein FlgD